MNEAVRARVRADDAVVVLVDMQERLASAMPRRDETVRAARLLGRAAAPFGIPVIVTRQYPAGLGDTVPELAAAGGAEQPVDKVAFDCMAEPAFVERLRRTGRRVMVIAGMEAHICVTQTALAALDAGYAVHVAADAVCSRRDADRDVALERLRTAGAVVTTVESVLYECLGVAGTPVFREVLALVKEQSPPS